MKILFVGYRDQRHSQFGGYDYIVNYPNSDYLDASTLLFGNIPVGKPGKKLNLIIQFIHANLIKNKYDILHFFYGDFMLFSTAPKKRKAKFIATIHMRTENFSQKKIERLKSYDAVIVLSDEEKRNLIKKNINAFFVPHGFNKPSFNNLSLKYLDSNKVNIFYSGTNYRDFDTFMKTVKQLECNDNVHFYAVGQSKENKEKLQNQKNVTICSRLSDDEYYSLLSACDYNFLPLTFATANNALLEAQSLGIVSILPNIQGVSDYADMKENIIYSDKEKIYSIISQLPKNESKNQMLLSFSEKFSWSNIYKQLEEIYRNI